MEIIAEIPNVFRVVKFDLLRRTAGVDFHKIPPTFFDHIDAIDRVIHAPGACSPGAVGEVEPPWYMHPSQADNLGVMHGKRDIDLYTRKHGRIESFVVTGNRIEHNGKVILEDAGMVIWPRYVFHRIKSCEIEGSASLNFAVHYDGFNIRTNFNIYDLDPVQGRARVIREGFKDQPGNS